MSTSPQQGSGTLVLGGTGVPLPVEIRDMQLTLVTTGSMGESMTLAAGTYVVSVPVPVGPEFHTVIDIAPGGLYALHGPWDAPQSGESTWNHPAADAAVALVEKGRLDAALHILSHRMADLPPAALTLLGFTALQVNDLGQAQQASDLLAEPSPDGLALRAALLRARGADPADVAEEALRLGLPELTAAAFSLVAALRDADRPATPQSRALIRVVRAADPSRVRLRYPDRRGDLAKIVNEAWPDPPSSPAAMRQVLADRTFRALFAAQAMSSFGINVARAAVIALVYQRTESPLASAASAAAFAVSYLPWLVLGTRLSAVTQRHSLRRVMVGADLLRAGIVFIIAFFSGLAVPYLIALLFVNALLSLPHDTARSVVLPRLLHGGPLATAYALQRIAGQVALVAGYAAGAALTFVDARYALLLNTATFCVAALLVRVYVKDGTTTAPAEPGGNALRDTFEGCRVVFGSPVLRSIALVVFAGVGTCVVPEGLAAVWAAHLSGGSNALYLGLILVSAAVGFVVGSGLVMRFVDPPRRVLLIRPLALLTPLALVPAYLDLGIASVVGMTLLSGAALSAVLPATNALFVQVLPPGHRGKAFRVMQAGVYLVQGLTVGLTGWLSSHYELPQVVGLFSAAGVVVIAIIVATWPSQKTIATAQQAAAAADDHDQDTGDLAADADAALAAWSSDYTKLDAGAPVYAFQARRAHE